MFDINFYSKFDSLVYQREDMFDKLEGIRSKEPIMYNIETTNACNMSCKMCPRTTLMTRNIETIDRGLFVSIVEQLKPHKVSDWLRWEEFVYNRYDINSCDTSENHFFLYIIPKVIQLHGYGDPLLDRNMDYYIKVLKDKGFESYFSCNPANIDLNRTVQMFENGLDYIKYSIESVDDAIHQQIRGPKSNFTESYKKILHLLDLKQKNNYNTKIIITMLDLNRENQDKEFNRLKELFKGLDVYVYFKSEDQQWYREDYHRTQSIHWSEVCKHPWMSMTIKSNGEAAMCMEDYNNEIILGNAKSSSLYDIWNGEKYYRFREYHINLTKNLKCVDKCDMKLVGNFV